MVREITNDNLDKITEIVDYNSEQFDEYVTDLKDTLAAHEELYYLCANQIGINAQMFALKFDSCCAVFSNPVFLKMEDNILSRELDFANKKYYIIPRASKVTMCYIMENKAPNQNIFEGDTSALMCKLVDCLNGSQCSDFGLEITEEFDSASDEERELVLKEYISQLEELSAKLDTDLSNNETYKEAWTNYKFSRAVALGEVELEEPNKPNRKQRRFLDKLFKKKKGDKL